MWEFCCRYAPNFPTISVTISGLTKTLEKGC